jgi:phage terminase Nu1 subunit (DNA packaging protein)
MTSTHALASRPKAAETPPATGPAVVEVSRHQLAAILGVHPDRVSEYGQAGLPVLHRGGAGGSAESRRSRYDAIACAQWVRRHRPGLAIATEARAQLDVRRREEIEQRLAIKAGTLVPAVGVEQLLTRVVTEARNQFLAVPTRLTGLRPALSGEDLLAVDTLIRETLTNLADGTGARVEMPHGQ